MNESVAMELPNSTELYLLDPPYPDFTQLKPVLLLFIVIHVAVIVLSIVGNALVCLTVYRNKKMHTAVNYYIVNLALSDLLVGAFVMPVKLLELTAPAEWYILNDALCTLMLYVQTVFVFSSVLTLVATCVERYFAIVHPLESRMHHSKSRAKRILFAVWITSCIVSSPFLHPAKAFENFLSSDYGSVHRLTCFDNFSNAFRQGYFIFLFIFIYLLSLCFIIGTCVRIFQALLLGMSFHRQGSLRRQESNRRKVAKMVIVVVSAYVLFWTPYFIVTIVTQLQSENFLQRGQYFFTMLSINFLAFANSCVNPFIYAAMSVRFRQGFRSIFLLLCCSLCPELRKKLSDQYTNGESHNGKSYLVNRGGTGRCLSNNASYSDTPPCSSQDANSGNNANSTQLTTMVRVADMCVHSSKSTSGNCENILISRSVTVKVDKSDVSRQNNNCDASHRGDCYFHEKLQDCPPQEGAKEGTSHLKTRSSAPSSVRSAWVHLTNYASTVKKQLLKVIDRRPYRNLNSNNSASSNDTKRNPEHQLVSDERTSPWNGLRSEMHLISMAHLSSSSMVTVLKTTIPENCSNWKCHQHLPHYDLSKGCHAFFCMSHSSPNIMAAVTADPSVTSLKHTQWLSNLDGVSCLFSGTHIRRFLSDFVLPSYSNQISSDV